MSTASPAPELAALARQAAGDPETALTTVLRLLCEQLGMGVAMLGRIVGEVHEVHLAVGPAGRLPELEGDQPAAASWCGRVPSDRPLLVEDTSTDPEPLAVTEALGIGCYAGTTVRGTDGRVLGVLGVAGREGRTTLGPRDVAVLEALAGVVGELFPGLLRAAPVPPPRRAPDLARVADAVAGADGLEELTRPLLEALHDVSGIASTYLTVVHEDAGSQEVRYSRNGRDGFVPEGLEVPWADTLCKRALEEGRACTTDVPDVWGDSRTAQDLGIVTYVSVPVRLADGTVWGTLCGADDVAHEDAAGHLTTLSLFATLIASEVERAAVQDSPRVARPVPEAGPDALTGCAPRPAVEPWLDAALGACLPGEVVAVVHLDVDAFGPVNEVLGHAVGDALLADLGSRLRGTAGPADLVARLGADAFLVAARLPRGETDALLARVRAAGRFALPHARGPVQVRCAAGLGVSAGPADADPTALLARADAAMHQDKPLQP